MNQVSQYEQVSVYAEEYDQPVLPPAQWDIAAFQEIGKSNR